MKFALLGFQETTAAKVLQNVRLSLDEVSRVGIDGDGQAVTLVAPTGAGKTVMAAAVLESLLDGDAVHASDDTLTVVWLSDLPSVNEQTRRRIASASDSLEPRLVQIDNSFRGSELPPGRIYFLNTQKLRETSHLVAPSESPGYTIWEILNRTIERDPSRFLLIIDEAHRGMEQGADSGPNSIIQRFILGSPEMIKSPTILGISATPKRFDDLIAGTSRTVRKATAEISEVRESGLIKQRAIVWRPQVGLEDTEWALLQRAAQDLQNYVLRWRRYCEKQGEPIVAPVLVVQVQDKSGDSISATDLNQAIELIEEVLGPQHPDAFAHSFGDAPAPLSVDGSRRLRYLKPADIDADPEVRVVFFKTSLSTGWDCPRAEVMMSFRTARQSDAIAQLVGRMVRTPLARTISDDEVLNSVALYLPHYDRGAVQDIIKQLKAGDPDVFPAIDAEDGSESAVCDRDDDLFSRIQASIGNLRTYVVPRLERLPPVRTLELLAGCLSDFGLRPAAPSEVADGLSQLLWDQLQTKRGEAAFEKAIQDSKKIGLTATTLEYVTGAVKDRTIQIESTARTVERLYDQAGNRAGAGLHERLWRRILDSDSDLTPDQAYLLVIAVIRQDSALSALEAKAREMFEQWLGEYQEQIDGLPEHERTEVERLRERIQLPTAGGMHLPVSIASKRTDRTTDWPRHLYKDADGHFPDRLTVPEEALVETELHTPDFLCWLRNKPRQRWALAFPYSKSPTELAPAYPDFLFFYDVAGTVAVDLIDTHGIHLDDAPAKARGLATYAKDHGHRFRRLEMVIYDENDKRKSLNLKSITVRDQVLKVTTREHLQALYDIAG